MKFFFLALTVAATGVAAQANAQTQQLPAQRLMELRSAVQQSQLRTVGAPTRVAPRQLSAEERAVLRRQLQEHNTKSRS